MYLNFFESDPKKRLDIVKQIIKETPPEKLTHQYLVYLTDYIIKAVAKDKKQKRNLNTQNRLKTIYSHETSYEGLAAKFEGGEDNLYSLFSYDGKNAFLIPKISITQKDLQDIPYLKEFQNAIKKVQQQYQNATGKKKYLLKKQIIEMCQDQYVIKNAFKPPVYSMNLIRGFHKILFDDDIQVVNGEIIDNSLISFFNPKHISLLLCNYAKLKEDSWGDFTSDGYYLMQDFENIVDNALKEKYPLYYDLMIYKIDGKNNKDIQELIKEDYGVQYAVEYISKLWRQTIPKLIAESAEKEYLVWYYTTHDKEGSWKVCSKCGRRKPKNKKFFSKNGKGFYSICKDCRNKVSTQHKLTPLEKELRDFKRKE